MWKKFCQQCSHAHAEYFLSVHYEQIYSLCAVQTQEGYAEQVNVPPEIQCSTICNAAMRNITVTVPRTHTKTDRHSAARQNTCKTAVAACESVAKHKVV